ncbi:MAG: hypothetical protein COX77_01855 [Candidatus Komeilibacteria bacterium CG_4_10_14_0_2_um_filter_37_10]|uniref:DUF11 domain-containing protein n=1 Tax=Candidatus Komeilibacteria bacterium CG_4_10_14_0_2_um_filter_37_10 TaxID=1974470 RepID=A0A2M7VFH1_9BACT|nr:MAG: hypothetical protein COX77_01855 [Candidatus Komeilibacteria bacterium CG_4_10_14_0_2_um_filter_37_10]
MNSSRIIDLRQQRRIKPQPAMRINRPNISSQPQQHSRRNPFFVFLGLFIIFVALAVWFGLVDQGSGESSLQLAFAGQTEVTAGEEIIFKIKYRNLDRVALQNMKMTLIYPEGFYYVSSSVLPQNDGKNYWSLPDLAPGESAFLEVKGLITGKQDETKEIKVRTDYQPANFSSDFSVEEKMLVHIKKVAVDLWSDAPSEILPGGGLFIKLHLLNNQKDAFPIRVVIQKPEQYLLSDSDPKLTGDRWEFNEIVPGQEQLILLNGELPPTVPTKELLIKIIAYKINNGQETVLDQENILIKIVQPQVDVNLQYLDNESSGIVAWGQTIPYQIVITNKSDYILHDAKVILSLSSKMINWQGWQDSQGIVKDGDKIIWSSDHPQIGQRLKEFKQNDKIVINLNVQLQTAPIDANSFTTADLTVQAVAKIEQMINGENFVQTSQASRLIINQNGELSLKVLYFDVAGKPLGSGPLPPQVNKETTYQVEWYYFAGMAATQNNSWTANLPATVQFVSVLAGLAPLVDQQTRRITIPLGNLSAEQKVQGSFKITLKPLAEQVDQIAPLLTNINLSINQQWEKKYADMDSSLPLDLGASGKGRVVK